MSLSVLGKIASGWEHTVLVSDSGKFYGFGIGRNGELGHKQGFITYEPNDMDLPYVPQPANKQSIRVAVGAKHSLILVDGLVYSMGSGENGRLGHGELYGQVQFSNKERISFIACGTDYSIAVGEKGTNLYIWGLVTSDGSPSKDILRPELFHIIDPRTGMRKRNKIVQVACGSQHSLALCDDGEVYSWGLGKQGRLGHGNVEDSPNPTLIKFFVSSPEQRVIQIAAADSHSMALNREGRVYTWGSGSYGRLGLGTDSDHYVPKNVSALRNTFVRIISCSTYHSLAIAQTSNHQGILFTWGGGRYGKLGHNNEQNVYTPKPVDFFTRQSSFVVINAVCGLHHTICVMMDDNTHETSVYSWGSAKNLRCGHSSTESIAFYAEPKCVDFFSDRNNRIHEDYSAKKGSEPQESQPKAQYVCAGESHSLALCDGKLLGWGSNASGQLGVGHQELSLRPIPISLGIGGKDVVHRVACGTAFSICVTVSGNVYTWGANDYGQLGVGDYDGRYLPTLVKALQGSQIDQIAAGYTHAAAVAGPKEKNKIYIWGNNISGQLGINEPKLARQPYPAPLTFRPPFDTLELALGRDHTMILGKKRIKDGNDNTETYVSVVYACGDGKSGQLGLGNLGTQCQPVEIRYWEGWKETQLKTDAAEGDEIELQSLGKEKQLQQQLMQSSDSFATNNDDIPLTNVIIINDVKIRRPRIQSIVAGERSSFAIHSGKSNDKLFAWGFQPGLYPTPPLSPRIVKRFHPSRIKNLRGRSNRPVFNLRIKQVAAGKNHFLALTTYNMDDSNSDVYAWGDSQYGKLGLGSVLDLLSEIRDTEGTDTAVTKTTATEKTEMKKEEKKAVAPSGGATVGEGGATDEKDAKAPKEEENFNISSTIPPQLIKSLHNKNISQLSCFADHSLAASTTGVAYAWGYGDSGRLGLSDGADDGIGNRSESEPAIIPAFHTDIKIGSLGKKTDRTTLTVDASTQSADIVLVQEQEKKEKRDEDKEKFIEKRKNDIILSYERRLTEYTEAMNRMERQKDLAHLAILQRLDASQGHKQSLTQKKRPVELLQAKRAKLRPPATQYINLYGRFKRPHKLKDEKSIREPDDENEILLELLNKSKGKKVETLPSRMSFYKDRPPVGELNPLETIMGRLHLQPCQVWKLFARVSAELETRTAFCDRLKNKNKGINRVSVQNEIAEHTRVIEILKNSFTDLLFSLYDVDTESDRRLMQVFLQLILTDHCQTKNDSILPEDSLEWWVFFHVFHAGRMRHRIRTELAKCLKHTKLRKNPQKEPIEALDQYRSTSNKDDVVDSIAVMKTRGDILVDIFVDNTKAIVECIEWPLEVLLHALKKNKRDPNATYIGELLVFLFASILLRDPQRSRRRFFDEKKHERESDYMDSDSEALVLLLLRNPEEFQQHLSKSYKIPMEVTSPCIAKPDKLTRMRLNRDFPANSPPPLTGQLSLPLSARNESEEKRKTRLKSLCQNVFSKFDSDISISSVDENLNDFSILLFKDYVTNRSQYKRIVRPLTLSAVQLIQKEIKDIGDSTIHGEEGNYSYTNYRLDKFHVDRFVENVECQKCFIIHPKVTEPEVQNEEALGENKIVVRNKPEMEFKLDAEKCVQLFNLLTKEQEIRKIAQTVTGQGAWKEIRKEIKRKKLLHAQGGDDELSRKYDKALRYLDGILDEKHTTIYLGNMDTPAIKGVKSVIEPLLLYKLLGEVEKRMQIGRELEIKRLQSIEAVSGDFFGPEIQNLQMEEKNLRMSFEALTKSQEASKGGTSAASTKLHVYQERGLVQRYDYLDLVKNGALNRVDHVDPELESKFFSYGCLSFFSCIWKAPTRNALEFLQNITFLFATTKNPDLIQCKLVYTGSSGKKKGETLLHDFEISISKLDSGDTKCDRFTYDPFGDDVPIEQKVFFQFNRSELSLLLKRLPRPRQANVLTDDKKTFPRFI